MKLIPILEFSFKLYIKEKVDTLLLVINLKSVNDNNTLSVITSFANLFLSLKFKLWTPLPNTIDELSWNTDIVPTVSALPPVFKTPPLKTKTLETIFNENLLHGKFNTLVLDLQGTEMLALKGLKDIINEFDIIYTEVNEKEIYKECCILEDLDLYLNKYNFVSTL